MDFRLPRRLRVAALAAVTTLSLLGSGVTAPPAGAATVGAAIEKASGTTDIASGVASDAANVAIVTTVENGTVSIPRDAGSGIQFAAGDQLTDFGLGLPASGEPTATASGTQVYAGSSAGFSTAVQPLADGARALVHIDAKGSPLAYRFPVKLPPGGKLVPSVDDSGNVDGGVDITVTTQDGDGLDAATGVIAHIEQPWAKDANGVAFPARYTVVGDTLVLNVVDSTKQCGRFGCNVLQAQYPMVADPSVIRNCGIVTCSFYFTRHVTRNLKDLVGSNVGLSTAAAGVICNLIPHPVGKILCVAALLVVGAPAAYNVVAAANRGGCFVVRINMAVWALTGSTPEGLALALRFANVSAQNRYCRA